MSLGRTCALLLPLIVAACASYSGLGLRPGTSSAADVERVMGQPAEVRRLPNGETVLWQPRLPYGRESYAARIGPDGKLIALEQRLTEENLRKIEPNKSTKDDVLDVLGPPYRKDPYPRMDREAWTYPMKDGSGEWTLGVVQFSPDGVAREAYYIRDPEAVRINGGM